MSFGEKESSFLLSKWYLDCVADDGGVFLGYAAKLSWKGLSLNYASVLQSGPGQETKTGTTLCRHRLRPLRLLRPRRGFPKLEQTIRETSIKLNPLRL